MTWTPLRRHSAAGEHTRAVQRHWRGRVEPVAPPGARSGVDAVLTVLRGRNSLLVLDHTDALLAHEAGVSALVTVLAAVLRGGAALHVLLTARRSLSDVVLSDEQAEAAPSPPDLLMPEDERPSVLQPPQPQQQGWSSDRLHTTPAPLAPLSGAAGASDSSLLKTAVLPLPPPPPLGAAAAVSAATTTGDTADAPPPPPLTTSEAGRVDAPGARSYVGAAVPPPPPPPRAVRQSGGGSSLLLCAVCL